MVRHWPVAVGAIWFPALYLITLGAQRVRRDAGTEPFSLCLICGDRGGADFALNVVLFLPFGLLAARRLGIGRTFVFAALLSTSIELLQLGIPGRYSTLADIVANATGALAGAVLYHALASVWRGFRPPLAAGLMLAVIPGGVTLAGGWLVEPAPTQAEYFGQWTPNHGRGQRYRGSVIEAQFNGQPFLDGRLPDEWDLPEAMLADWALTGTVRKGPPPPWIASILSIFDGDEQEILYLGASGEHLLLRERLRAQDWGLDRPELVSFNALARVDVGDTMRVAARRAGADRCLSVNGAETCDLGFTPGRLWSLLLYPGSAPPWMQRTADGAWLFVLFAPLGLFASSLRGVVATAGLAGGGVILAVATTRLTLDPFLEPAGALLGLIFGFGFAWALRRLGGTPCGDASA